MPSVGIFAVPGLKRTSFPPFLGKWHGCLIKILRPFMNLSNLTTGIILPHVFAILETNIHSRKAIAAPGRFRIKAFGLARSAFQADCFGVCAAGRDMFVDGFEWCVDGAEGAVANSHLTPSLGIRNNGSRSILKGLRQFFSIRLFPSSPFFDENINITSHLLPKT